MVSLMPHVSHRSSCLLDPRWIGVGSPPDRVCIAQLGLARDSRTLLPLSSPRVRPGVEPATQPSHPSRVVDVIDGPDHAKIAHVDVIGEPDQTIDELRHPGLLSG